MNFDSIEKMCAKFITALFAIFIVLIFISFLTDNTVKLIESVTLNFLIKLIFMIFVSVCLILFIRVCSKYFNLIDKLTTYKKIIIIVIAAVLPRLLTAIFIKIQPASDFLTYHNLASELSKGMVVYNDYISIFPHIIGYPCVLSIFYKIFSSSVIVASGLNILLSCGISVLLYFIGCEVKNYNYGFISAFLWAFCPSQIFYTVVVCTEYLFTFFLLLFFYLFIVYMKKIKGILILGIFFSFLGIMCSLINAIRPLGLLKVVSVIGFYCIFYPQKTYIVNILTTKVVFIFLLLFFYFATNQSINFSISKAINKDTATFPIGFNLYVGVNSKSGGIWNYNDSMELGRIQKEYDLTPQEIHNYFLTQALYRLKNQDIRQDVKLLVNKFKIMWLGDIDAIFTIKNPNAIYKIGSSDNSVYNMDKLFVSGIIISLLYYYFLLGLCLVSSVYYLRNFEHKYELLFFIFILGVVILHLIVEAAPRYHFNCISLITLIAPLGIYNYVKIKAR